MMVQFQLVARLCSWSTGAERRAPRADVKIAVAEGPAPVTLTAGLRAHKRLFTDEGVEPVGASIDG